MEEARRWIETDESAMEMLARTLARRPFLLMPPLHRVPLRVGNVVEIVGPSSSAKSEILLQAAVNCILPKDWNGVHFGGLEQLVVYFDLDCRFDVLRLSHALRCRIMEASGFAKGEFQVGSLHFHETVDPSSYSSEELFLVCMRRFLYIRCYSSSEFLSTLKTMRHRIQKESEAQGVRVRFLMIDRRNFSLQCITESIVLEISRLLQMEPMLVLATKAAILRIELTRNELRGLSSGKWAFEENFGSTREQEKYREFMPSAWQAFVTHRVLLRVSEEKLRDVDDKLLPIYMSQWVVPPLNYSDKFYVTDVGFFCCCLIIQYRLSPDLGFHPPQGMSLLFHLCSWRSTVKSKVYALKGGGLDPCLKLSVRPSPIILSPNAANVPLQRAATWQPADHEVLIFHFG
ncbi:unnamed protein product [Spirodela intermedia]|uniref:Uncharacterized protein n=1 Tax=Spirodela intermedia TaxID=51605 RepID=A0A7I8JFW7_SPIIN|nr:unnamed protein product [Spirodela intermedia]CAA6668403.1 unnamed protein product [Spirodela intermedia]